jgi:hypothetical protein
MALTGDAMEGPDQIYKDALFGTPGFGGGQ